MKKIFLPFMVIMLALAGCQTTSDDVVEINPDNCIGDCTSEIRYSSPNGNDLVLETKKHVIQIQGQGDTQYSYYVWTGGKDTSQDPDLIVQDGNAMVLVEE